MLDEARGARDDSAREQVKRETKSHKRTKEVMATIKAEVESSRQALNEQKAALASEKELSLRRKERVVGLQRQLASEKEARIAATEKCSEKEAELVSALKQQLESERARTDQTNSSFAEDRQPQAQPQPEPALEPERRRRQPKQFAGSSADRLHSDHKRQLARKERERAAHERTRVAREEADCTFTPRVGGPSVEQDGGRNRAQEESYRAALAENAALRRQLASQGQEKAALEEELEASQGEAAAASSRAKDVEAVAKAERAMRRSKTDRIVLLWALSSI